MIKSTLFYLIVLFTFVSTQQTVHLPLRFFDSDFQCQTIIANGSLFYKGWSTVGNTVKLSVQVNPYIPTPGPVYHIEFNAESGITRKIDKVNSIRDSFQSRIYQSPSNRYHIQRKGEKTWFIVDQFRNFNMKTDLDFVFEDRFLMDLVWSPNETMVWFRRDDYSSGYIGYISAGEFRLFWLAEFHANQESVWVEVLLSRPSIDGKVIARGSSNTGGSRLWKIDLYRLNAEELLTDIRFTPYSAQFTPDGKYIYLVDDTRFVILNARTNEVLSVNSLSSIYTDDKRLGFASIAYSAEYMYVVGINSSVPKICRLPKISNFIEPVIATVTSTSPNILLPPAQPTLINPLPGGGGE
jgi:hypothetical protein